METKTLSLLKIGIGILLATPSLAEAASQTRHDVKRVSHAVGQMARKVGRPRGAAYAEEISRAVMRESRERNVDPVLLLSIIATESEFIPNKRGSHGEMGLMQLKPSTAKWISDREDIDWRGARALSTPAVNIKIGAAYIAFLRRQFKSQPRLYLAAYNMGIGSVSRLVRKRRIPPKAYYAKVMRWYSLFNKELSVKVAAADRT